MVGRGGGAGVECRVGGYCHLQSTVCSPRRGGHQVARGGGGGGGAGVECRVGEVVTFSRLSVAPGEEGTRSLVVVGGGGWSAG